MGDGRKMSQGARRPLQVVSEKGEDGKARHRSYWVRDARGARVSSLFSSYDAADARRLEIEQKIQLKSRQKERVCIVEGCNTKLISDGPHHRMCNRCRLHADDWMAA